MCLLHSFANYLFVFVCETSDCRILTVEACEKQRERSSPPHRGPGLGHWLAWSQSGVVTDVELISQTRKLANDKLENWRNLFESNGHKICKSK